MSDTATAAAPRPQREHILDTALALMSKQGAADTSMRQLAAACGINVAILYRYFPSKEDILRSVIEERRYDVLLRNPPVADFGLPPRPRLIALMEAMWEGSEEEEPIVKLLLGEAFRGEPHALAVGGELLTMIESTVVQWLPKLFPELAGEPEAATRVIMGQLFSLFVEAQFVEGSARRALARQRAEDLAEVLFPEAT
jgi:AcrR family transcriptional regulator